MKKSTCDVVKVNEWGVFKCISRIKAEEEIWNKVVPVLVELKFTWNLEVVDEIFEIDNIVKREKQLRHLSRCL